MQEFQPIDYSFTSLFLQHSVQSMQCFHRWATSVFHRWVVVESSVTSGLQLIAKTGFHILQACMLERFSQNLER